MLQRACAKMQGKERKRQFQDNSSNSQEGATGKGEAFFSQYKFCEKLIEYMFELLCGINLIDAEKLRVDKE